MILILFATACAPSYMETDEAIPSNAIVVKVDGTEVYLRSHNALSVSGESFHTSSLPLEVEVDDYFRYQTWVTAYAVTTIVGSYELELSVDESATYEITVGEINFEYQKPYQGYDTTLWVESAAAALHD
jgi:hypothetical protein